MATLSSSYITLLDVAKRSNAQGGIADIIEILAAMSPVVRAGYAEMCNNGNSNDTTMRMSLPSPTWIQFYSRITPVKSTTKQVSDTTGMLEGLTDIDERIVKKSKDPAKLLLSEATAVLEGFAQEIESTFFYGNTAMAPLEFLGLAPRMNSTTAENGRQIVTVGSVVGGGGSGSTNTSMFITTWGPRTGMLIYPENTVSGVQREPKGVVRSETTAGVLFYVEEKFSQHCGYAMPDWRYHVRVPNIDVTKLTTNSAADLVDLLITAYYRLPGYRSTTGFNGEGAPVKITPTVYVNATIKEALHKQMLRQPNGMLTKGEFFGEEVMTVMGMPVLETDGIVNDETAVA